MTVVIQHIAVFRWKPGTTAAEIAAIDAALDALPAAVPSLRDYRHGPDLALGTGRWDFGIVATFDDLEGWRAYDAHPAHDQVRTEVIGPHVGDRAAVQISS